MRDSKNEQQISRKEERKKEEKGSSRMGLE
jgi:hypothetical protein